MEFKDFSLFIKGTKVQEFVAGLERGELRATRCPQCRTAYYPPRHDCPRCFSDELDWVTLNDAGELLSYTTIYVPPEHFLPDLGKGPPFARFDYRPAPVGILQLENGLQVMGWIVGVEPEELHVGLRLRPEVQLLPDGRATIVLRPEGRA